MLEQVNLDLIRAIAVEAGDEVMKIYQRDFHIEYKEDSSPLTEADLKANDIICSKLHKLYPHIPILSEENQEIPYEQRKSWEYFWCIDPIDGTKEFIKKNGEFTINIALIHKNTPVLGVVYAPALDKIYSAKKGDGAFFNQQLLPLHTNKKPKEQLTILTSKSHLSEQTIDYIKSLNVKSIEQRAIGSSLKICMVASGEADMYPKIGPTMEWDTAAGDAIVRECEKMIYNFDTEKPLLYNKENLLNPSFIVK
jgi:3'(2'), 5'-bisphosphate nucleotidase